MRRPSYNPDAFGSFAETIARFLGTGRYLGIQSVLVVIWIAINVAVIALRFDPYPFILLNLMFSTQAAYAAPLILLASNRTAQSDRLTLEHAAAETDLGEQQNDELLRGNTEILKRIVALEEQILSLEKTIVGLLKPGSEVDPAH